MACLAGGGILKSDTISFGQALVPAVIDSAMAAAREADAIEVFYLPSYSRELNATR